MDGKIIRCACGRLYRLMSLYCGDQSVCGKCQSELERELRGQSNG